MLKIEQIQEELTQVIEPKLGKNIVDLGMVKDIQIENCEVTVTLALMKKNYAHKDQLTQHVQAVVGNLAGVEGVTIKLTTMTQEESHQLRERMSPAMNLNRIGRIVAVMSGKGGVGKSSVTALLATALQRKGMKVGVLDADLTGPSIPRLFGITGPVQALPFGMMPIESQLGIKVISTNLMLPEEDMAVLWRGPIMSSTIRQFWSEVLWGTLDYLLIDLPPGTSDATITVMQSLPLNGVVMVTTPQSLSSMVVRKTVHMAQSLDISVLGIVENMSYFIAPETGTKHMIFGPSHTDAVSQLAEAPVLGELPIDPELALLADKGEIELYEHPAYAELAAAFLEAAPLLEPTPTAPWLK